jgi:TonB-dependent starch-binding outer membrane protein SusC
MLSLTIGFKPFFKGVEVYCLPGWLQMKLTFVLLITFMLQVNAKGFSQKITFSGKNVPLEKLFNVIEEQTGYVVFYNYTVIQGARPVTIHAKDAPLEQFLKDCLSNQELKYVIEGKTILVTKKDMAAVIETTPNLPPPIKVHGHVSSKSGSSMGGATVTLKGTKISVLTDSNGNFSINVPEDGTLVISYIGYKSEEVTVNGQSELIVSIQELNKGLEEVVVLGYQSQKRSDITGAVSVVNIKDVARLPVATVDQALQGQAAGIRVTQSTGQPGEAVAVRIRGVGTINNDDPLYIIDGVPTKDGINFLSSNDVASITILKDAASAAIYGARSANGVIVITTKTGKAGKAQFNYNGFYGIQTHGYLTPMTNNQQYVELYNEAATNDNATVSNPILLRPLIPDTLQMANTNWEEAIFQNAPIQSHELSVNGGSDKTQYFVSANLFNQDGIILNSWYKRYALHTKLNMQLTDKLNMGLNINLSYTDKNAIGSSGDGFGGNGGSVVRYALFRTPAIPIYNADGSYSDLPANPSYFGDGYNPVALAAYTNNTEKQYRVFGDVYAQYFILKNLVFKTDLGTDVFTNEDRLYNRNYGTNLRVNSPSVLTLSTTTSENFNWNNTLRYNTVFKDVHNLSILLGTEAITNSTATHGGSDRNFPDQIPSLEYLGNGLDISSVKVFQTLTEWSLFSLFGNINYNYKSRYYATFNVRRDGSSRFGADNRFANFFSGSAGWSLNNEDWFRVLAPVVSKAKLRASYGELGNQDIGNYPWASVVTQGYNYVLGNTPRSVQGYTISERGNPDVKWESSTMADAGLDFGLWNDRLTGSVDYFVKTTNDLLVRKPLPLIGGSALPPFQNDGSIQNKGWEFELNYRKTSGRLQYNISANFATLHNEVLSLANNAPIEGGRIDNGIFATLTAVGHPIGAFYGYQMEGIFQNQGDIFKHAYQGPGVVPGDVMYKDQNGDGLINDSDRTFLGSAIPLYTFGLNMTFNYSNFDLSIFFQGAYGNKIYSQVNQDIEGFYRPFNLTENVYNNRWHGEGTSNTMPLVSWNQASNNIKEPSSRFLQDASYVRLKNIQLGYTIPSKITSKGNIKSLRIYFTSENLLTFTKFKGLDPEMHVSNNVNAEQYKGDLAAGIDWGTYPTARSYILGINLSF